MALSKISITVSDGNLGIVPSSGAQNFVLFDVCPLGVPGQFYVFNSLTNVASQLGPGSASALVANVLSGGGGSPAGGPVSFVPVEPSVAGSLGAVSHFGSGSGAITLTTAPIRQITIAYTSSGAPGVAQYKVQLGSDAYSGPYTVPSVADGYVARIPGTFTHVTFGSGTYNSGDGYVFDTVGGATATGTSPGLTADSDPLDDFNVTVTVSAAGAVGAAKAVVTLDGYSQSGGAFVLSTKYAIPLQNSNCTTGIVLNSSSTFVAGDTYSFLTCGPTASNSAFETAATGIQSATPFSMLYFNNKHSSATLADAFATNVTDATSVMFTQYKFLRALMNTPSAGSVATSGGNLVTCTDTVSSIESAFAAQGSTRVGCGAYDEIIPDPTTGLQLRRNFAWNIMARLAQNTPVVAASRVKDGPVGTGAISQDERLNEGLSDAGFSVPTTIQGRSGVYVNQALTFSFKNASDYSYIELGRVMDLACSVVYSQLLNYLNDQTIVDPKTGFILNSAAVVIENTLNNALASQLIKVTPQQASAASASVGRTNDILSDSTLYVTVTITPVGYIREISLTIGFGLQG